jgi:hypothetical protein
VDIPRHRRLLDHVLLYLIHVVLILVMLMVGVMIVVVIMYIHTQHIYGIKLFVRQLRELMSGKVKTKAMFLVMNSAALLMVVRVVAY